MTREEAIKVLHHIVQVADISDCGIKEIDGIDEEAIEIAIKALEQEPCNTDTYKVVKAYMNEWDKPNNSNVISLEVVIEWLKTKDIIKLSSQEEVARKELKALSPVTPEPCEDEYIKVPKKALKYRTKGMVAYNYEWLKNHFDIERTVICGEQEPCEVEAVKQAYNKGFEDCKQAVVDMAGLSDWFDSSDSYNEFVIALSELPPVTPQPKTIQEKQA